MKNRPLLTAIAALGSGSRFLFASREESRFRPRFFHAPANDKPGNPGRSIEDRLTDALAEVGTLTSDRDTARSERDTARNELTTARADVTRLTEQFNAATTTATTAQAEVTRLTSELATVTAARDTANANLTRANENVSRLEKLCGLNGVDPAAAVETQSQQQSSGLLDKFLKANASDKVAMLKKDGAALYAEARARGIQVG